MDTTTTTTTTTTTEKKYRTITLTGRRPVRIGEAMWPVIAYGAEDWHDGQIRDQAVRTYDAAIRVRQHADGRAIAYGTYRYASAHQCERNIDARAGVMVAPGDDIAAAIESVAATLLDRVGSDERASTLIRDARDSAIADLPAETL